MFFQASHPPRWTPQPKGLLLLAAVLLLSQAACSDGPRVRELYNRASEMWNSAQYEKAARNFLILVELYPRSKHADEALYWSANLKQHYLEDDKSAIELYEQLLKSYPNSSYSFQSKQSLAEIYAKESSTVHRALNLYRNIITDAPREEQPKILLTSAEIAIQHQQFLQARNSLHQLIDRYPQSPQAPQAHYLAAYSYFVEGHTDIAITTFKKVAKKFPEHPVATDALFFIADTLEQQGKMRQAVAAFRQVQKTPHAEKNLLQKRIQNLQKRIRRAVR